MTPATKKLMNAEIAEARGRELTPSDRALQSESIKEAAEVIDDWFARRADKFKALIQTYADDKAQELFDALREQFWAMPARDK